MTYVNTQKLLNEILGRISDNTGAMRARCLNWLNDAMRSVVSEPRDWEFLRKKATLTITANQIPLPADYERGTSIQTGDCFFTPDEELTEEEAFLSTQTAGTTPTGYTEEQTTITFYPAATGTATLRYVAGMPTDYADDETDTVFPVEFANLLKRAVLTVCYEYDIDERGAVSIQLDQAELKKMKKLDNKRKARPKLNPAGYRREPV